MFGSKKIVHAVLGFVAIFVALLVKGMFPDLDDEIISQAIKWIATISGGGVLGQALADAASKGLTSSNFQRDEKTSFADVAKASGVGALKNLQSLLVPASTSGSRQAESAGDSGEGVSQ